MKPLTTSETRQVEEMLGMAFAKPRAMTPEEIEMAFAKLRALTPEEFERREKMRPRPYDLSDPEERDRLLRESAGYAKVSLHYGTDDKGRRYASEALDLALRSGFRLVPPDGSQS